jgi:hypothetical protein
MTLSHFNLLHLKPIPKILFQIVLACPDLCSSSLTLNYGILLHCAQLTLRFAFIPSMCNVFDSLCGIVVRVPDYRSTRPRFDSRHYQIFGETVFLVCS